MAQWSLADRTLFAKLVYYGPALGGKTTNLRVLYEVTDPQGRGRLVSVNTADDRTLFFDLLPFELGSVLGYKVALKLYTVPGQSQYDATRRAVLSGADAVVFVADSDAVRENDNRQAWANLAQNMRAAKLDTAVPVLAQFNKRDLPGAAPLEAVASWLSLPKDRGFPAVACQGQGVVETFIAASKAMIHRIVSMAEPGTRRSLDVGDLEAQLDTSLAPYLARGSSSASVVLRPASAPIVLDATDLLESAVASSAALGAQLTDQHARASRLEREGESLRRLSEALRLTGASFERDKVLDAGLDAAVATLGAAGAALCVMDGEGLVRIERSAGVDLAPLASDAESGPILGRMIARGSVTVVDDVNCELPSKNSPTGGMHGLAVVPVERRQRASLVVAMPGPDGAFLSEDVRFLATLAGHLAVGLEKVRIHEELRAHRDRLEDVVSARTRSLRKAYDELKRVDAMKDRFLGNVSHEMLSPLTAIIGAATFLKDYGGGTAENEEMAAGVLESARTLQSLVDDLLRVARLDAGDVATVQQVAPVDVVVEALRIAGAEEVAPPWIDPRIESLPADPARLARALGNVIDNAMKFGGGIEPVEIRVEPCVLKRPGGLAPGVVFSVLDRGPGIATEDVERAFDPFEQGGDALTGKPAGVGLGLYEARVIARRHGGTLVHRPRAGGGSEFRISLPAESAAVSPARQVRRG
jgi:mutual gliding-motility protein MglA